MAQLTPHDLSHFKLLLRTRREELSAHLRSALMAAGCEKYDTLAGQVHDTGDESISALLIGVDFAGRERELYEMRDVEAALSRIASGSYGQCLDCGGHIGRDRLEAYPTAKRCLHCQQRHDVSRTAGSDASPSL